MAHGRTDRQYQQLLAKCLEQAEMGILVSEIEGRIVHANPAFERITGLSAVRLRREGMAARKLLGVDEDTIREILKTVRNGRTWRGRLRARRLEGESYWLGLSAVPLREADHRVTHVAAYMRDITEQVEMERRVARAQRLEVLERVAAGVAHDVNNLLGAIHALVELVEMKIPQGDALRQEMREIMGATEVGTRLTRQLLLLARGQEETVEVVDLNALVKGLKPMLRRVLEGHGICLCVRTTADVLPVRVRPTQLEQVLLNLVLNARDATPAGGRITIRTGTDQPVDGCSRSCNPGRWTVLEVADTGTGMTDDVLEHLFEPFYTTKEPGKGTGLGLAICQEIVVRAGGRISVDSAPGRGTTVRVSLPLGPDAQSPSDGDRGDEMVGSRRVLLVDLDRSLREVVSRRLRGQGWCVLEAEDLDQALARWRERRTRVHALVVCGALPGRSGTQFPDRLQGLDTELRVVLVGRPSPTGVPEPFGPGVRVVAPSVDPEETADRVCHVLEGSPGSPGEVP